jgi:hypothetical protein
MTTPVMNVGIWIVAHACPQTTGEEGVHLDGADLRPRKQSPRTSCVWEDSLPLAI